MVTLESLAHCDWKTETWTKLRPTVWPVPGPSCTVGLDAALAALSFSCAVVCALLAGIAYKV